MISKRTLENWRGSALREFEKEFPDTPTKMSISDYEHLISCYKFVNGRVIRLTQILLDQHLLRKRGG